MTISIDTKPTESIPLTVSVSDVITVGETRVTLDTVVGAFQKRCDPRRDRLSVSISASRRCICSHWLLSRSIRGSSRNTSKNGNDKRKRSARKRAALPFSWYPQSPSCPASFHLQHRNNTMLRLAADENLNDNIIRGLLRRRPDWISCEFGMLGYRVLTIPQFSSGLLKKVGYCSRTMSPRSLVLPMNESTRPVYARGFRDQPKTLSPECD